MITSSPSGHCAWQLGASCMALMHRASVNAEIIHTYCPCIPGPQWCIQHQTAGVGASAGFQMLQLSHICRIHSSIQLKGMVMMVMVRDPQNSLVQLSHQ